MAWSAGRVRGGGGAGNPGTGIHNSGVWDSQSDLVMNNDFGGNATVFNNRGTFRKSGGNGTVFQNFGTFRKEAGTGATVFPSGTTFNNSGTLDVESGVIALQGPYSLANGTRMNFGIAYTASYGRVALSGASAFSGRVRATFNDIFYWPPVGTTFSLLSYTSGTGTLFTNTALSVFITWATNYGSTAYSISVVARSTNTAPDLVYAAPLNKSNLVVKWRGDHTGWLLQSQTNPLTVSLTRNWVTVSGSGETNQVGMTISKSLGTVFYRMVYS